MKFSENKEKFNTLLKDAIKGASNAPAFIAIFSDYLENQKELAISSSYHTTTTDGILYDADIDGNNLTLYLLRGVNKIKNTLKVSLVPSEIQYKIPNKIGTCHRVYINDHSIGQEFLFVFHE